MTPTPHDIAFLRELDRAGGTLAGVLSGAASAAKARAVRAGWATRGKRAVQVRFRGSTLETTYTLTDAGRGLIAGGGA